MFKHTSKRAFSPPSRMLMHMSLGMSQHMPLSQVAVARRCSFGARQNCTVLAPKRYSFGARGHAWPVCAGPKECRAIWIRLRRSSRGTLLSHRRPTHVCTHGLHTCPRACLRMRRKRTRRYAGVWCCYWRRHVRRRHRSRRIRCCNGRRHVRRISPCDDAWSRRSRYPCCADRCCPPSTVAFPARPRDCARAHAHLCHRRWWLVRRCTSGRRPVQPTTARRRSGTGPRSRVSDAIRHGDISATSMQAMTI